MAKRREIHGQSVRTWPYGVTVHIRRRIAAWRKRGFSEAEVREMAQLLRRIGPAYRGPDTPASERANPSTHAPSNGHGNHRASVEDPLSRTRPQKHRSRYRAKHGSA